MILIILRVAIGLIALAIVGILVLAAYGAALREEHRDQPD